MPADDLTINVRQIAGYPPATSAPTSAAILMQLAGLGSAYASISPAALVGTALATGGDMTINGSLSALSFNGGSASFANAAVGILSAQTACFTELGAMSGTIGGVRIATVADLAAQYAASVNSFNGRVGNVSLWIDDIICAGGAPIYSPRFQGDPRACTPSPNSNSTRLATTQFVTTAVGAMTAASGSSDGQLATTAFVQNAVASGVAGVASFNTRTGAVVLTGADLTSAGGALLASPALTGTPTAPTAAPGTATTQLATAAFVMNAVSSVVAGVSSFNTRTGAVTLTSGDLTSAGGALLASTVASFNGRTGAVFLLANDISGATGALLASPAFTGTPTAPTPTAGDNSTRLATTAFVASASGFAPINSPAFTGVPTAPTAAVGTNTLQLATTAYVLAAVAAGTAGVSTFNSRSGAVTLLAADLSAAGGALLASPALTGTPSAPTATAATSTTQIATTAFVHAALPVASAAAPLMDGTAAAGASAAWSRGDHVHPTDTSRAAATALANYLPLAGGTLTGTLFGTLASFTGAVSGAGIASSGQVSATSGFINGPCSVTGALTLAVGDTSIMASGNNSYLTINGGTAGVQGANLILSSGGRSGNAIEFDWADGNMGSFDTAANFTVNAGASKPGGGAWSATSDARIKTVEGDYGLGLTEIEALRPVRYRYKGNDAPPDSSSRHSQVAGKAFVGLVAQEVETIFPGMVSQHEGYIDGEAVADLRTLDPSELLFALVNAVKQLAARLATLEAA